MATNQEIVRAYRHLYKTLLRAVQYSHYSRQVALTQLRAGFRDPDAVFDREGIKRTTWFLECAARERGIEHRVLKNLIRVNQERTNPDKTFRRIVHEGKAEHVLEHEIKTKFWHYDMTVAMLNKTMGLCLR